MSPGRKMMVWIGAALLVAVLFLPVDRGSREHQGPQIPETDELSSETISERLPGDFTVTTTFDPIALRDGFGLRLIGERSTVVFYLVGTKVFSRESFDGRTPPDWSGVLPSMAEESPCSLVLSKTGNVVELSVGSATLLDRPVKPWQTFGELQHVYPIGRSKPPLGKVRIQKTASLYFADDFMRAEDEAGQWELVSGTWQTHGIQNPARSANAFRLQCTGETATALAGHSFWRDYSVDVSVRAVDAKSVGVLLNVADGDGYELVWEKAHGGRLVIRRRWRGETRDLAAQPFRLPRGQWTRFSASSVRGRLRLAVDDRVEVTAYDNAHFPNGRVGLVASSSDESVYWDDVELRSVTGACLDLTDPQTAHRPYLTMEKRDTGDGAAITAGQPITPHGFSRRNCTIAVEMAPKDTTEPWHYELRTRLYDGANYAFMALRGESGVLSCEVGVMDRGSRRVLETCETGNAGGVHRSSFTALDDLLIARFDDDTLSVVKSPVAPFEGFCQVLNGRSPMSLRAISFDAATPPPVLNRLHRVFSHEKSMSTWSHPGNDWSPAKTQTGTVFWHRSDFWSDVVVELDLAKLAETQGEVDGAGVVVGADPDSPAGAQRYVLRAQEGSVSVRRFTGDQQQEQRTVDVSSPKTFAVTRIGTKLVVRLNGRVVFIDDAADIADGLARIGVVGMPAPAASKSSRARSAKKRSPDQALRPPDWHEAINVRASHMQTYTFGHAPVDWQVASGTWEVTNRWQCDPRWSFFSGYNLDGPSCLWHKMPHGDNVSVEFFVGPKMDRDRGSGYEYAADFNAVICADGSDIDSGYSFMYGGWDNTGSFICRKQERVAANPDCVIPRSKGIHRRWFHVKLRKHGPKLLFEVDGQKAAEWTDPAPMSGGHWGLWTWKNAFMISQVRVSTDGSPPIMEPLPPVPSEPATPYGTAQNGE